MTLRGFSCIGLDNPKHAINLGGVFRSAYNFDVSLVVMGGIRPKRIRHAADTVKAHRSIPHLFVDHVLDGVPHDCVPVAVDLIEGASSLVEYKHPDRAFYVFGAEDATLDQRVTSRCRDVVYVPTTRCMNLGVTVAVVLYDRMAKSANLDGKINAKT